MRVLYLLLGDVSLNKLLQNPAVVDVRVATGTQRPVSLSVTKHKSSLKVVPNWSVCIQFYTSYFMPYNAHLLSLISQDVINSSSSFCTHFTMKDQHLTFHWFMHKCYWFILSVTWWECTFYRFMDELEIQVALAAIGIRLCSGLQIVPVVFSTVEILKLHDTNWVRLRRQRRVK